MRNGMKFARACLLLGVGVLLGGCASFRARCPNCGASAPVWSETSRICRNCEKPPKPQCSKCGAKAPVWDHKNKRCGKCDVTPPPVSIELPPPPAPQGLAQEERKKFHKAFAAALGDFDHGDYVEAAAKYGTILRDLTQADPRFVRNVLEAQIVCHFLAGDLAKTNKLLEEYSATYIEDPLDREAMPAQLKFIHQVASGARPLGNR